jgi:Tol biopolymer transport system component
MALGALAYFLDGDLYVADWNGAKPVRIINGRPGTGGCTDEFWAEGTIWSPDGRYLAARHATRCQDGLSRWWDAVIIDPEGEVVASIPSEGWLISWSPDSKRVAVWITWGETIGVYGLDGERQAVLDLPGGLMAPGDFDPVWSSDGTSLLVPHGVEIPLDGSTPRQLPPDDPRSQDAAYAPDGSRVAYVDHNGSLVLAAADGSDAQEAIAPRVERPVWSPSGDRIAFIYSERGDRASTELRVLDVTTGEVTSLVAGTGGSDLLWGVIEFSPEGDRILFSRTDDSGRDTSSLWSINADSSDPRRLVTGTVWGDWQALSPTR